MLNLNEITAFPQEVIEKIGFYVYRLLDPRNGETFYVGKGKGNRVFNHSKLVKETLLAEEAKKSELIKELKKGEKSGFSVSLNRETFKQNLHQKYCAE